MARPKNPVPAYKHHKPTNTARCWVNGQWVSLGRCNSPESRQAHARVCAELAVSPAPSLAPRPAPAATVDEVLLAFWRHAEQHYRRPDGSTTDTLTEYRAAFRPLRELYGTSPAAEFAPLALKAVRQRMVESGVCRSVVNSRVGKLKRVFKWAVAEELLPVATYQALATVAGLQKGRTGVRDHDPVGPIDDAVVDAVLPFLNRHVRGLVEFQRLTGCRPGEACRVRRCDINMGGAVWIYTPEYHKNTHKGKARPIPVGPKAQALLREFFTPNIEDYLFSPRRGVEEFNAAKSAGRKTPRYSSHVRRNARKRVGARRKRPPAERYNRRSSVTAVDRACDRAFPPSGDLARRAGEWVTKWRARLTAEQRDEVKEWQKAHRWSPNQLRHTFATRVRKEHGLEAAQVLLGHSRADTTQVYAERNLTLAVEVAAEVG
jgi:integrase